MIVDTNTKLTASQRKWTITQIVDSMLETGFIPESQDRIDEQIAWLGKLTDSSLICEFAGWNPGAIVND